MTTAQRIAEKIARRRIAAKFTPQDSARVWHAAHGKLKAIAATLKDPALKKKVEALIEEAVRTYDHAKGDPKKVKAAHDKVEEVASAVFDAPGNSQAHTKIQHVISELNIDMFAFPGYHE